MAERDETCLAPVGDNIGQHLVGAAHRAYGRPPRSSAVDGCLARGKVVEHRLALAPHLDPVGEVAVDTDRMPRFMGTRCG